MKEGSYPNRRLPSFLGESEIPKRRTVVEMPRVYKSETKGSPRRSPLSQG